MSFDRRVVFFLGAIITASACASREEPVRATESAIGDDESCDGLPRLRDVTTPPGVCVGIVTRDLPMARGIARLDDDRFLVTSWASESDGSGSGAIWLVQRGAPPARLAAGLDRPHGIVVTETGEVYVAEPNDVFRFHLDRPDWKDIIIGDLPSDGLHWATTLAYDPRTRSLYVNKGSASDNCAIRDASGVRFVYPCPEENERAHVRRYSLDDPSSFTVVGRGLRNSVALAVHPDSGVLLQAENGQNDLNMENPPEELNVLGAPSEQGTTRHFGWPYCWGSGRPSPGYSGELGTLSGRPFTDEDCQRYTVAPALLLPPHSAPLGMDIVRGGAFPFRGSLVVALHGFAKTGHKLVVVDVDQRGVPTGASPRDLVWGWGGHPEEGRPMGKPVSVLAARDGSLMVTDDRNGMVLRITCDRSRGSCEPSGQTVDTMPPDPERARRCADLDRRLAAGPSLMAQLQRDVIDPHCVSCHGNPLARPGGIVLRECDDIGAASWMKDGSNPWVVPGNPEGSRLMPIVALGMGGLSAAQLVELRNWIAAGAPAP